MLFSFSGLTEIPLYIGAKRSNPNDTFRWITGNVKSSDFYAHNRKIDNLSGAELNCILVYLKPDGLHYKYGLCSDGHYYMCSSIPYGKFSKVTLATNHHFETIIGFNDDIKDHTQ